MLAPLMHLENTMKLIFALLGLVIVIGGLWAFYPRTDGGVAVAPSALAPEVVAAPLAPREVKKSVTKPAPAAAMPRSPDSDRKFKTVGDLLRENRRDAALELLQEMIRDNPQDDRALAELGSLLLGDPKNGARGIEALQKALAINPENDRALGELIFAPAGKKTKGEILENVRGLYEANPKSPNLAAGLGRLLADQRDFDRAALLLEQSSTDPYFAQSSLSSLIEVYDRSGQPVQEIRAFERLIAAQEQALERQRKGGDDAKGFESAIVVNKLGLASKLIESGQFDGAERLLQQVREQAPEDPGVADLMKKLSRKRAG